MYDRILVPTDGSDPATAAVREAVELAALSGATVHALYVVDTGTNWLTISKDEVRDTLRDLGTQEADRVLGAVEPLAADAGVELVTESQEGPVDDEILAAIESDDVDLVVMGTHGRDGLRRRLLGSVTERVVRESPVPVMTVTADGN